MFYALRDREVNYPCAVKHYSRKYIYPQEKDVNPKDLFSEDCLETYKILLFLACYFTCQLLGSAEQMPIEQKIGNAVIGGHASTVNPNTRNLIEIKK